MELIELDATAQRALELLTNAGMSDGSIYNYKATNLCRWTCNERKRRLFSYTGKTCCTLNRRRTGGTGISMYFRRWLLGRSRCKRRNHWISGGRSAHAERQPQRELYAQHPLHQ